MQTITLLRKKENEKKLFVDSRICICICCGSTKVDIFEFGVSCENCGTSLYFGLDTKQAQN